MDDIYTKMNKFINWFFENRHDVNIWAKIAKMMPLLFEKYPDNMDVVVDTVEYLETIWKYENGVINIGEN